MRGVVLVAAVAAALGCAPAALAAGDDAAVQVETLAVPATGTGIETDPQAEGGKALRFFSDRTASGSIVTQRPAAVLAVRARGVSCDGPPTMIVSLDGRTVQTASVRSGVYTEYLVDLHVAPGAHDVSIAFTNAYGKGGTLFAAPCTRQLIADRLTLYAYPFAADSFAAASLADDSPIDADSASFVAELGRLRDEVAPDGTPMRVSTVTTGYGVPVYTVSPGQAKTRVALTTVTNPALQQAFASVPLPSWAVPAGGSDHTLVVWQPSTGRMWEFWRLRQDMLGDWLADWGGYVRDVHGFAGHYGGSTDQANWGASASGIGLLSGLQRIDELQDGVIEHAVALHVPGADPEAFRWPAQRTDGRVSKEPSTLQEGMRFRLPPGLDLSSLGLSPYALTVARAVQRYGLVVTDVSNGCLCFIGEDSGQTGTDPYTGPDGIFGGDRPDFTNFPWDRLELLAVPP